MKNKYILFLLFIIFNSCVTKPDDKNASGVIVTKSNQVSPVNSLINNAYPPLSKLKADLMKSAKTILAENPNAVMTTGETINMGKGGYFGDGQFYGYTWQLKNSLVDQVNFIMEYDVQSYNDWIEKSMAIYGKGRDLNGNGIVWLIPEMDGITLLIVNGGNKMIIASAGIGYVNIP